MWSPWRSRHIRSADRRTNEERASLFLRIAEADADEENFVLWRGDTAFVVMNLFPYNNGHLLIVPFRKVEDYDALTSEEQIELAVLTDRCIRWLRQAVEPDGFNVGMNLGRAAGAGVPEHLHVHVVPRWGGDTNFMPTLADTKVVPESMEETYRKLRAAVEAIT
jgi:ATP adenylyltransferase